MEYCCGTLLGPAADGAGCAGCHGSQLARLHLHGHLPEMHGHADLASSYMVFMASCSRWLSACPASNAIPCAGASPRDARTC